MAGLARARLVAYVALVAAAATALGGRVLDCGEEVIEYAGITLEHAVNNSSTADEVAAPRVHPIPGHHYAADAFTPLHRDERFTWQDVVRTELRAPTHSCMIKHYPGVKRFLAAFPRLPGLIVAPYSQPTNWVFFGPEDSIVEQVQIEYGATCRDIAEFARSRGVAVPFIAASGDAAVDAECSGGQ